MGDPSDPSNMMGALVSKEHLAKVTGYVKLAREEGCSVLCGHGMEELQLPKRNEQGYFMRPTVITDVADSSRLMQEEVFGPVTCIVSFKTEEEVCLFFFFFFLVFIPCWIIILIGSLKILSFRLLSVLTMCSTDFRPPCGVRMQESSTEWHKP